MKDRTPSVSRVLKAYSWNAAQIGVEAKEPIEYPTEDKRIYTPQEDGAQNGNFSGQVFRELSERQVGGELGSKPNLRERPPRDGVGDNFSLPNDKKYKIGRVVNRHMGRRVANRYLIAARTVDLNIKHSYWYWDNLVGDGDEREETFTVQRAASVREAIDEAVKKLMRDYRWKRDNETVVRNKQWKNENGVLKFESDTHTRNRQAPPGFASKKEEWGHKLEFHFSSEGKDFPHDVLQRTLEYLQTGQVRRLAGFLAGQGFSRGMGMKSAATPPPVNLQVSYLYTLEDETLPLRRVEKNYGVTADSVREAIEQAAKVLAGVTEWRDGNQRVVGNTLQRWIEHRGDLKFRVVFTKFPDRSEWVEGETYGIERSKTYGVQTYEEKTHEITFSFSSNGKPLPNDMLNKTLNYLNTGRG